MSIKGKQCYDASWACNDCGGIKFDNSLNSVYELDSLKQHGMRITARSSEPLAMLRLNIPFYNVSNLTPTVISPDSPNPNFLQIILHHHRAMIGMFDFGQMVGFEDFIFQTI